MSGAARVARGAALASVLISTAAWTLPPGAPAGAGDPSPSTERALGRWAAALGGRETLLRVRSVHLEGTVEMGGLKGTYERWSTARGAFRVSVDIPGAFRQVVVFDGLNGWLMDRSGTVSALSGGTLAGTVSSAYEASYSFLVPGRMAGRVALATGEGGTPDVVLRLEAEGGVPVTITLDGATSLPRREQSQGPMGTRTILFSDWEERSGLMFPGTVRQSNGDPKLDAVFRTTRVGVDEALAGTLFTRPAPAAPPVRFAPGTNRAVIPVEVYEEHVFVPVHLGDAVTGWFFFDSGAAQSFVSSGTAEKAGLAPRGAMGVIGTGAGSATMGSAGPVVLGLPGVEIPLDSIAVWDFSSMLPALGRAWDGDLGHDVISRFVVRLDYERREISFYDPESFVADERATALPVTFMGALPIIQAKLLLRGRAAIDIACAIDSGASGVHLTAPFVRENDLMASLTKTIAASSLGAGGESVEIAARVDGLQLGPYLLRRPIVEISPDPKEGLLANPELGGLLGGEILGRFTVTFDYPHRRILLEPNRLFPDPFLADQSGLSILARGPGFHRFEIDGVEPNSPADAAGILRGDVIVAVDSHPAMELDLDRMGRLLERTGRTILVTVERDGRALDFSLDLKERL